MLRPVAVIFITFLHQAASAADNLGPTADFAAGDLDRASGVWASPEFNASLQGFNSSVNASFEALNYPRYFPMTDGERADELPPAIKYGIPPDAVVSDGDSGSGVVPINPRNTWEPDSPSFENELNTPLSNRMNSIILE